MSIPFFLKPKRDKEANYQEIQGVKFFVLNGKKGSNCLFAAEQAALDDASDKFAPGFSLIAKLARQISEAEGMKITQAYDVIIGTQDEDEKQEFDSQELRIKYGAEFADLNVKLDREASAKKIAVVTVAISNRCYQALEDEYQSLPQDSEERAALYEAIGSIKGWSEKDTKNKLSQGYIDEVYQFLETQRNGGEDPTSETNKPTEDDLKKGSEEDKPTGQKSSGESKNTGQMTKDSQAKTLAANPVG